MHLLCPLRLGARGKKFRGQNVAWQLTDTFLTILIRKQYRIHTECSLAPPVYVSYYFNRNRESTQLGNLGLLLVGTNTDEELGQWIPNSAFRNSIKNRHSHHSRHGDEVAPDLERNSRRHEGQC